MYNVTMKKSWYIEGYTQNGAAYCRECVAETLSDEAFSSPYCVESHEDFKPIFASDIDSEELEELYCEYCFEALVKE